MGMEPPMNTDGHRWRGSRPHGTAHMLGEQSESVFICVHLWFPFLPTPD